MDHILTDMIRIMQSFISERNKISPLAHMKGGYRGVCCYWCMKRVLKAAYHYGGNKNPKSKTLRTHRDFKSHGKNYRR